MSQKFKAITYVLVLILRLVATSEESVSFAEDGAAPSAISGDQLFRLGVHELSQKRYLPAVEKFSQSLARGHKNSEIYQLRASAYFRLGMNSNALEDLDQSLHLDPLNAGSHMLKAMIFEGMALTEKALFEVTQAISITPDKGYYYRFRGALHIARADFLMAIQDLTAAIAYGEGHATVYENRGLAHERLGRYHDAEADYSRALELAPFKLGTQIHHGITLVCLGDYEKALKQFNKLLSLDPHKPDILALRAWVYLKSKNDQAALDDLESLLKQGSDDPWVYLNLGYLYYRTDKPSQAVHMSDKAIALLEQASRPEDEELRSEVYFQKGYLLLVGDETKKALLMYAEGGKYAEKTLGLVTVIETIEQLEELEKSANVNKKIVKLLLKQLAETKEKIAAHGGSAIGKCRKIVT